MYDFELSIRPISEQNNSLVALIALFCPNSCRSEENPCHLLVARTPNFVRFLIFVQSSKEFDFILLTEMTYAFYLLALVVRNNIYLYPRMAQFIVIQYFLYFVRFDYLAPHMAVL